MKSGSAMALVCIAQLLSGCKPAEPELAVPEASSSAKQASMKPKAIHGLGLHAYNYTDLPIWSYTVNGAGGGDIRVSGPTNGGSGTSCCGSVPAHLPTTYIVRWSRDDHRWCELAVAFNGPVPADPFNLNTHFYRDGHVEISVSDDSEPPRLKLSNINDGLSRTETGNVVYDEKFAKCKDET
jgi:Protein of unknown function (DUF3304)